MRNSPFIEDYGKDRNGKFNRNWAIKDYESFKLGSIFLDIKRIQKDMDMILFFRFISKHNKINDVKILKKSSDIT